ncbi:MAG: hypothetical protein GX060_02335 [Firmicutes bacterium]|nr:hypothetical protein [Bacillota bacterium]
MRKTTLGPPCRCLIKLGEECSLVYQTRVSQRPHKSRADTNGFFVTAAAALILTVSLSTSSGFLYGQHLLLRYYLGGDITILPGKLVFTQEELNRENLALSWADYPEPWQNEAPGFLSRLPYDGWLTTAGYAEAVDLARVAEAVQGQAAVEFLYPYYGIPGIVEFPGRGGAAGRLITLRGRALDIDEYWQIEKYAPSSSEELFTIMTGAVVSTQDFTPNDMLNMLQAFRALDGQPVCIINTAALPQGVPAPDVGEELTVYVPKFDRVAQEYDFAHLTPVSLQVVGHMSVAVSTYEFGAEARLPYYWLSDAVHVPLDTWQQIAAQVGIDPEPQQVGQLGLVLNDTTLATELEHTLRQVLPEYTVLTAAEMMTLVNRATSQAGLPLDMDSAFHLLIILITGLIVATNAFLLIMQRRKEIAILKSIGASHWNIVTLILAELVALSLAASCVGWLFYRLPMVISLAMFAVPWPEIWRQTLTVGGQVTGVLVLGAVIFGLIPAVHAARTPVMEVLRDA